MLAREFFEDQNEVVKAKLAVLFQLMADTGSIRNKSKFKKEEGDIYTFKVKTSEGRLIRMPCFRINSRWIITHGFMKSTSKNKWLPANFDTSNRIMLEHQEWEESENSQEQIEFKATATTKKRKR